MRGLISFCLVLTTVTSSYARDNSIFASAGGYKPAPLKMKTFFDPKNQTPRWELRAPASDQISPPYQPRVWCQTASLKSRDLAEALWRQYFSQIDILESGSITPQELLTQVFLAAEESGLSARVAQIDWEDVKEHLKKSLSDQVAPLLKEEKAPPSAQVARTVLNLLCARTFASARRF